MIPQNPNPHHHHHLYLFPICSLQLKLGFILILQIFQHFFLLIILVIFEVFDTMSTHYNCFQSLNYYSPKACIFSSARSLYPSRFFVSATIHKSHQPISFQTKVQHIHTLYMYIWFHFSILAIYSDYFSCCNC